MKINLKDPNVAEELIDGNIGTPGRIAKLWMGADNNDDSELGCGRWAKKPRLAVFPNTSTSTDIPIIKRVDVISNCSHHLVSFNTKSRPDSYAIIAYIPDKFVLGISKLQRLTDWISRRFWLQEDLTQTLYNEICLAAKTDSVYIKLVNLVHGCESLRGAQSSDGAFSSEMYGGKFIDHKMREQVDRSI
jgi:GTP cyclohydrolase I